MALAYPYFNCSSNAASSVYAYYSSAFSTVQQNNQVLTQLMNAKCNAFGLGPLKTCDFSNLIAEHCDCSISITSISSPGDFCLRKMPTSVFSAACQNFPSLDSLQHDVNSRQSERLSCGIAMTVVAGIFFLIFAFRLVYFKCCRKTPQRRTTIRMLSLPTSSSRTGTHEESAEFGTSSIDNAVHTQENSAAGHRRSSQNSDGVQHSRLSQELSQRFDSDDCDNRLQNELGIFSDFLDFCGIQWIRNRDRSERWKVHRFRFFSIWIIIASISIWFRVSSFSYDQIGIQAHQYNAFADLQRLLMAQISVIQSPLNAFNPNFISTYDYNECLVANASFLMLAEPNVNAVHANNSQLAFYILYYATALISFMLCAWHWKYDNPVSSALVHLQQLIPEQHQRCCAFANRSAFVCLGLLFISSIASLCLLELTKEGLNIKDSVFWYYLLGGACANFPFFILLVFSILMVATFSFIAGIVRVRMRSFLSLVKFAHKAQNSSSTETSHDDVSNTLSTLNCPHSMSLAWRSLNVSSSSIESAAWLRSQLPRIWLTQMRETNAMIGHNRAWLASQIVASFAQLCVIITYLSVSPSYTQYNNLYLRIAQTVFGFFQTSSSPFIALCMLTFSRWQIDSVCREIEITLDAASAEADDSADLQCNVCRGDGSIGELLVFCRISSNHTACLYGIPMNLTSLLRYAVYLGCVLLLFITILS
jgi:hypothetical protein